MSIPLLASYETFIRRVPGIASLNQLAEETLLAVASTGLDTLQAGTFPSVGDAAKSQFHFGNWPASWMELYVTKFIDADPLPGEVRLRFVPFTWTEFIARRPLLPEAKEVMDTVKAWGWSEGFVIPVHGPGSFIGIVSFCGHKVAPLDAMTRALVASVGHVAFARGYELHAGAHGGRTADHAPRRGRQHRCGSGRSARHFAQHRALPRRCGQAQAARADTVGSHGTAGQARADLAPTRFPARRQRWPDGDRGTGP